MAGVMRTVVVRDPDSVSGRPVFRGTRVPVEALFETLEDGLTIDEIVETYPSLDQADLIACVEGACIDAIAASL
jgi:uncharacterized protein (DUF433 family)